MKLTKTKKNKGMTLIELTVVILVLLSLISVLFIGARAWLRGSDRAQAAILIRNAQQGVRSHSNLLGVDTPPTGGTAIAWNLGRVDSSGNPVASLLQPEIFGPGAYVETPTAGVLPVHPDNDTAVNFTPGPAGDFESVPPLGVLYMTSTGPEPEFYEPSGVQ